MNTPTLKTGNIVEVKNAYFKNDNGLYFIAHSPGDPSWSGSDYSLHKIKKNGELSTAQDNIRFWPLSAFTNNRQKNIEAKAWNKENATITATAEINEHIRNYFNQEAERIKKQYKSDLIYYGETEYTELMKTIYEFYFNLASKMEAGHEQA